MNPMTRIYESIDDDKCKYSEWYDKYLTANKQLYIETLIDEKESNGSDVIFNQQDFDAFCEKLYPFAFEATDDEATEQ